MKLNVKTNYYMLGATCGCTKNSMGMCGVTWRVGS